MEKVIRLTRFLNVYLINLKDKNMKIIDLTSYNDGGKIYINVDHIGHFYENKHSIEKIFTYTTLGVTTHNNGGFKIKETVKQILKLIEASRGI
jgi:desulfoferrodoxin (superoxide reductase-like protein)